MRTYAEQTDEGFGLVESMEARPTQAFHPFPSLRDMGFWKPPAPEGDECRWVDVVIKLETDIRNVQGWDKIVRGYAEKKGLGITRYLHLKVDWLETVVGVPATESDDGSDILARRFEVDVAELLHG